MLPSVAQDMCTCVGQNVGGSTCGFVLGMGTDLCSGSVFCRNYSASFWSTLEIWLQTTHPTSE